MINENRSVKPTVFVIDDDPSMRKSLSWLIESVNLDVETYESANAYVEKHQPGRAGCILLDVRMPGMSGLDLQQQLKDLGSPTPIIVMTGHADVPMAVRALKSGAFDFIEKPFNDQVLLDSVQKAIEHDRQNRDAFSEVEEIEGRIGSLTKRETEVMGHVVDGNPNRRIAEMLGLSEKTIEVHRAHVMEKMRAKNAADLIRMVLSARNYQGSEAARS